jgi:hypothetical protein
MITTLKKSFFLSPSLKKYLVQIISICFFLLLLSLQANAEESPLVQAMNVKHVYVPSGFDSNDSVEIVVEGIFVIKSQLLR